MAVTEDRSGFLNKIKFTMTSTSNGASSDPTVYRYNGIVHRVVTIPDSGGTAPTAAWDVVVTDGDGVDVLNGLGADRSATATEQKAAIDGLGCVKSSSLTCTGSNMGDLKGATLIMYLLDIDKGEL